MTISTPVSTPALVLTIGRSMQSAIGEVERMFLGSKPRRAVVTRFLSLDFCAKNQEAKLVPLREAVPNKSRISVSWKQAYEQASLKEEDLKTGLRSTLHELRAHEKLIEVGLGDKSYLPLDVILIADLSEPDAAALPMLVSLFHSLLTDQPEAKVHLLLNLAVFEEDILAHASVYVSMQQLKELLNEGSQLQRPNGPLPYVYLFDRYKEGVWEVRDAGELQTILGNFLLALLSGGLAQHIAHSVSLADVADHQAFFNGASAGLLHLDMDQLRQTCATRLAAEILKAEFHSGIVPDPGPIEEMVSYFFENQANRILWIRELCRDTLFQPHTGGWEVDFHISDLQFETIPMEDWRQTIQEYNQVFNEKRWQPQEEHLRRNAERLHEQFNGKLVEFAQLLPEIPRLYPGGPGAARLVLQGIQQALQKSLSIPMLPTTARKDWDERIAEGLNRLESTLNLLPKPPRWVTRLPSFLRKPAIQLFQFIFLQRELRTLIVLRQDCVRLLEQKYASLFGQAIHQMLHDLVKGWEEALHVQLKKVTRLQSALDKAERQLADQAAAGLSASSSLFRLSVLDESILTWAFYFGNRPQAGFRHSLLLGRAFLRGWEKTNAKTLTARLMSFTQEVYQSLENIDLEQALQHSQEHDALSRATTLMQGLVPLLRPNFDQTGGGPSFQLRFFQTSDPRSSSLAPVLRSDMQEWQEICTDDSYLAIFSRVRLLIPLSALTPILERGRVAFETLAEEVKAEFSIS
jgi:hypothetical protein